MMAKLAAKLVRISPAHLMSPVKVVKIVIGSSNGAIRQSNRLLVILVAHDFRHIDSSSVAEVYASSTILRRRVVSFDNLGDAAYP